MFLQQYQKALNSVPERPLPLETHLDLRILFCVFASDFGLNFSTSHAGILFNRFLNNNWLVILSDNETDWHVFKLRLPEVDIGCHPFLSARPSKRTRGFLCCGLLRAVGHFLLTIMQLFCMFFLKNLIQTSGHVMSGVVGLCFFAGLPLTHLHLSLSCHMQSCRARCAGILSHSPSILLIVRLYTLRNCLCESFLASLMVEEIFFLTTLFPMFFCFHRMTLNKNRGIILHDWSVFCVRISKSPEGKETRREGGPNPEKVEGPNGGARRVEARRVGAQRDGGLKRGGQRSGAWTGGGPNLEKVGARRVGERGRKHLESLFDQKGPDRCPALIKSTQNHRRLHILYLAYHRRPQWNCIK